MHIQVSDHQKQIGESSQSAAEIQLAALAGQGFRKAPWRALSADRLRPDDLARKRLGRHERYATRGRVAREIPAPAVLISGKAPHGGLNVVYRRPDGNIGWIDAGPERVARG